MIIILPLIMGLLLFILKEIDYIIKYSLILIIILMKEMLYIGSNEIILILITLISLYWISINNNKGPNNILGILLVISTYLSITSTSLYSYFLSIEILSFIMIIIINLYIQDQYPGILYYLFSGLFTAIFILAIGYLSLGYNIGLSLINIVFMYKLSLAPFHILLPQIYNNLSPNIILLIDIPYKIILFYLYYRIFSITLNITPIIILSILVGSIGALGNKNLLSLMIYSSLFHYGLILINIYFQHWDYFIFYIIIYSMIVIIYLYLIIFKYITGMINNSYYMIMWFILLMNLIGIPPLTGFFIKLLPFYLCIYNNHILLFFISSFGLILLSYVYLRLLLSIILQERIFNIKNPHSNYSHLLSSLLLLSSFPIFL